MIETLRIALQVDPTNIKICQTIDKIRELLIQQVVRRLEHEVLNRKPEKYAIAEKLISEYKLKEASPLIAEIGSEEPRTPEAAFLVGYYNYMVGGAFHVF